ncbi:MAG: DUF3369 domain-containing protein [Oceanospirillaceae bacterium]
MYDFLIEDSTASADKETDAYNSWVILIVDDEPAIHTITKFALENEYFDGKKLTFLSAFNAKEAMDILRSRDDIALILLDVVMETESSGLEVAAWIREVLGNKLIRIVLRTGQPGQAPENTVILDYDIFDYKNKSELTAQKLFSCVISGLRSYRDVLALANHSKGLQQVVAATADIFKEQYASKYTSGVLLQLTSLLYFSADAALVTIDTNIPFDIKTTKISAAVGGYEKYLGKSVEQILSEETVQQCLDSDKVVFSQHAGNKIIFSYLSHDCHKTLLFLEYRKALSKDDTSLIELFVQSVASAQERMRFWQETEDTLNEVISLLSKTVEEHTNQGDQYFTGVTKIAMLLAKKHGLILRRQINQKVKF